MKTEQHLLPRRRERHFDNRVVWCFAQREPSAMASLLRAAGTNAGRTALIFEDQRWTYRELVAEIGRSAAGLEAMGVRAGDRVIMVVSNRPEFVTFFYAIQWLGAIAVPIDVRLKAHEVCHVANDAGAAFMIHDADLADRLPQPELLEQPLQALALPEGGDSLFPHMSASQAPAPALPSSEEDVAVILYTSGSTGKPKGAAIAHINIAHSVIHHSGNLGLAEEDCIAMAVPLSHITGLVCGVIAALLGGSTLLLLRRFKAVEFLEAAARHRMTYTVMVPAMYNLCLREPALATLDLSSWRIGHFGGSPMPLSTITTLAQKLPGLALFNGYGSTETCSPAVMSPAHEQALRIDSVGKPLACVEVMVVDPDTCIEVAPGETGEIWMRSPGVVKCYWNNPEATHSGIVAGFWRSGDIGRKDPDGYVYVFDRLKDMINRGGYKIYTAEVEDVLMRCPGVIEAAVVGRPDPVLGERVHAFVFSPSTDVTPERVQAFCEQLLGDYQVPETVTIVAAPLPRNSAGKLHKQELRSLAAALPAFVMPLRHGVSNA